MYRRALLAAPLFAPAIARAQLLDRPVRLIIPYSAGGVADTVARILQQRVSEQLGVSLIIENRTGAAGTIGAAYVAQSPPDGHTLLLEGATTITAPLANRSLLFDYGNMPICAQITAAPYVLGIRAGFPGDDLRSFLAEAKRRPGEVTFGTPGVAHIAHLMGELLQSLADVKLEHVPFRGGADAAREVAGGRIDACIISESSFKPVLQAERGRVIATTGSTRRPNLPNVPSIGEVLPGYELATWMMIFSPPGTSMPIRQRISQAFAAAVNDPRLRARIEESGNDPVSAGPEQAEALWLSERTKLTGLMQRAGLVQG